MTTRMFKLGLSKLAATASTGVEWLNADVVDATVAGPIAILPTGATQMAGMCRDFSGNLYFVDNARHIVVKVTGVGEATIVAGKSGTSGNNGNQNGVLATAARFNAPEGICCDKSGTLYVADTGNHQIRSIKGGLVNVVAGSGAAAFGFVDGDGSVARFKGPIAVCVDNAGALYVADRLNYAVRKVMPDGHTVTLAGNGVAGDKENVVPSAASRPSLQSCFTNITCIAVDAKGNVYVADTTTLKIKKITPDGSLYLFSGNGTSGTSLGTGPTALAPTSTYAYTCQYKAPYAMDVDRSGNLYLVDHDTTKSRIVKIDFEGRPSEVVDLNTALTYVNGPYSLAVSPGQQIFVGLIY